MTIVVFLVGCAIWSNSQIFSVRWRRKRGVPPGPINVKSLLFTYLQRFLLGVACIAGYFIGRIHFVWLIAGGTFLFTTVIGLLSVLVFQSTGGVNRFDKPSEGLRKYNVGKATSGVIFQSVILLAWVANWLTVWFGKT